MDRSGIKGQVGALAAACNAHQLGTVRRHGLVIVMEIGLSYMQVSVLALSLSVLLQDASERMQNGTGGPDDAPGKVSTTESLFQSCLLSYVDADSLVSHKMCICLRGLTPHAQTLGCKAGLAEVSYHSCRNPHLQRPARRLTGSLAALRLSEGQSPLHPVAILGQGAGANTLQQTAMRVTLTLRRWRARL